jgi:hypothetical protein
LSELEASGLVLASRLELGLASVSASRLESALALGSGPGSASGLQSESLLALV